ncbi:E3 ubiquitin-protein ligase TRIM47 isoform X1 [Bos javanicus]|uniref:E3 ubiquitin-protein ligase TRIM47 isoform X1 n=1 Tax=Bos javanicus TaxID=9906 RepID=UPI002AA859BA|nr:E3 ubiquitin-protein ligase TRIM47 isoform X1 [Bos javanicus]
MDGSGPFSCPICLEPLREPVTLPCGHNFCLACLGTLWPHRGAGGAGGPGGTARCPLCQEPFPDGLQLRKNHTLSELLQLRQGSGPGPGPCPAPAPGPAPAPEPATPSAPPSAPEPSAPCAPESWPPGEEPVRCDACPEGAALPAALSCLSCLASFCPAHLGPHERSPALRGHRLVPPLRRLEESLCPRHLRPLERYCRAERVCLCEACAAQEHRGHELVPLEQERALQEAEQPKVLSAVEDRMDELGAGIAQSRRTVALIKVRSCPTPPPSTPAAGSRRCELSAWHPPPQRNLCPGCGPAPLSTPISPLTWHRPRAVRACASVHPPTQQDMVGRRGSEKVAKTSLGCSLSSLLAPHCPVQSAAVAERERVSRLFAEAAAVLQGFQTQVLGFIDEGEATMLGRSQGDLRRQEEQRSRLSRARHNLSQVPEADSVSFLQELLALRLALEEGCGPGPGPPKELSFTKSSQAVRAVRAVLAAACSSQWEQLRGLGGDEDGLQKPGTEADAESQDPDSTNNLESEAPRDYFLKFAYIVDLDSDTADKFLQLFGTKGVKRVLCPINYPESPTRFTHCEQVLGEGALDRGTYYWEVEIIEGWVSVGVMAEDFSPQEPYDRGRLGRNAYSCCLQWNGRSFSVWFHGQEAPLPHPFSPTVGICLEYADRALAFYAVRDGKMSLLRRLRASRRRSGTPASPVDPFQSRLDSHFAGLFTRRLKPAFFLESVDAHLQIGPLKKSCISVLKRR